MKELPRVDLVSLSDSFPNIASALLTALEARELGLRRRAERVAGLTAQIGTKLGLDELQLRQLHFGSLLHDIGNIGIPDAILLKPSGLSDWEFQEVKLHPIIGEQICRPLESLISIRPLIRSHHEKLDGSGYPDRLSGDDIPQLVRILSVADVYHTLRSVRAYRAAFGHAEAMEILRGEVERGWWDSQIVSILESLPEPSADSFETI